MNSSFDRFFNATGKVSVQEFEVGVETIMTFEDALKRLEDAGEVIDPKIRKFRGEKQAEAGTRKMALVCFDRTIYSMGNAISLIEDLGLKPATLMDLCLFDLAYPEKQGEYPISAIGSTFFEWWGFKGIYTGLLCGGNEGRILSADYCGSFLLFSTLGLPLWFPHCRFLTVPKVSITL